MNTVTVDGMLDFSGGLNSGADPSLIARNQFARAVNLTVRDGLPQTRAGFTQVAEMLSGGFQGASTWQLNDGDRIVYVVAGHVRVYNVNTQVDIDLGSCFDATLRCYFGQVDRWFVIQDGISRPVVLQAVSGVVSIYGRDEPLVCLVPGTIMQYTHGRLHYVPTLVPTLSPSTPPYDVVPISSSQSGLMTIVSSDIRDSLNPEYVFRMSEHRVLAEGGAYSLPEELGLITGLVALRGAATGTGVGELVVFAREGVASFDFSFPRSQWQSVNVGRILFRGAGTISPFTILPLANDLLYLDSTDQVRRCMYDSALLNGYNGNLANTPLSYEMSAYSGLSTYAMLAKASAAVCDNRYLWTLYGAESTEFRGLGVLDAAHNFTLQRTATPVFDGVWTGFRFQQVLSARVGGVNRMFAIVKGVTTRNYLYVQDPTAVYDKGDIPIESIVVTRVLPFVSQNGADDLINLKELTSVELWVSQVKTNVSLTVLYRPQGYPTWQTLGTRVINMGGGGPQYRRKLKISVDLSEVPCDAISGKLLNVAGAFQFALKWTGHCRIARFRVNGLLHTEEPVDICETDNPTNTVLDVDEGLGEWDYEVTVP